MTLYAFFAAEGNGGGAMKNCPGREGPARAWAGGFSATGVLGGELVGGQSSLVGVWRKPRSGDGSSICAL